MNLLGARVLVTGAGGFIGSHLTEALISLGADVRAMVHYNSAGRWGWLDGGPAEKHADVVLGDVGDAESVRSALKERDVVFHLAALIGIPYSYKATHSYVRTNVEGTLNVLQGAREENARVIHTSTSEVYGSAVEVPIGEGHRLMAQSPYAASKIGADKLVEASVNSFGITATTLRPFNTYGPRQSLRAVIPTIVTQALQRRSPIRLGNVHPTRDFNFVTDTVRGFILAAESDHRGHEVFNLGTGIEVSIADIARLVGKILDREITIETAVERARVETSEVDRLCADAGKARRMLHWKPEVYLEQGLERTIAWFQDHLPTYRADTYGV